MKTRLVSYLELCKTKVALLSAFSTVVGFLLSGAEVTFRLIPVFLGVLFLAGGSLALNQYQDRNIDAAMPRTWGRPIPSRRIKPVNALYLSCLLLLGGFSILLLTGSLLACALGLFALVWYNGVYAWAKRKTAFAVIPGALIGAVPPAIGWVMGGGALQDPKLIVFCLFFFLWQVPHSCLHMMRYGREYEKAGIPSLTRIFSPSQIQRIIFNWVLATAVSCLFLSTTGLVHHLQINVLLLFVSSWLAWNGIKPLLRYNDVGDSVTIFKKTDYYLATVLFLLSADRLLSLR
jgi:protoheme IX farnesyltransferase